MMIPPSFCDLGKSTKDLFSKNFHFGILSLDYLSKSAQGVELSIKGDNDIKAGKLNGSLEWKYNFESGVKHSLKWDTKNSITSSVSIEDIIKSGSKLSADMGFSPDSGNKTLKFHSSFKNNYFNTGVDLSFPNIKPILTTSLTLGCTETKGYLAGAELTYDTDRMQLTKDRFSVGYHHGDLSVIGTLVNRTDIESLVFQKISPSLDIGVQINWNWNSRNTDFGVATKYAFDGTNSFCKAKINNKSVVGLAYCFKARDDVVMTLSAEIDAKDVEKGNHRFGMGLSYSP